MSENGDRKKLVKNSALMFIGQFASKVLVFFLVPFYTSVLSTEEYGISDLLVTTSNMTYPFFTLMISTAILRFCLDKTGDPYEIFSAGLWVDLAGYVLLMAVSFVFFPFVMEQKFLPYFLVYYFVYAINALLLNFLRGINNVKMYSISGVLHTVLLISSNLLLLLVFKLGIIGYLLSMIFSIGIVDVIVLIKTKIVKRIILPWNIDKRLLRGMIKYCIPLIPNQMSWWINDSSDRYIMNIYRTTSELGVYSASYKIPAIISTTMTIFNGAWEISAVDDFGSERNRKFFSETFEQYLHILVVVSTFVLVFLRPIAKLLLRKDFYTAWLFVPALLYATLFHGLSGFIGTIFTTAKKTNMIFLTTILGASANIVLNFCLIPNYGAQGAAIATAAGYIVTFVSRFVFSRKIMTLIVSYKCDLLVLALLLTACFLACYNTITSLGLCVIILLIEVKFVCKLLSTLFGIVRKAYESHKEC